MFAVSLTNTIYYYSWFSQLAAFAIYNVFCGFRRHVRILPFLTFCLVWKEFKTHFRKQEKKLSRNTELNLSDFYFYFSLYIGRYMNFEKAIEIETSVTKSIRTDDYLKLFGINYNMLFRRDGLCLSQ